MTRDIIVRIISMESGNGINSGKLKMPEGRERRVRGNSLAQHCIRPNCYEQMDTYAVEPHRERKEEENEVVTSYTGIRFDIFTKIWTQNFH